MMRLQLMLVVCLAAGLASSVPMREEPARRRPKAKDLSDETHYRAGEEEHNADYDHEAFLGKDQAERFDQLEPGEARRRLGIIVDKIDKDKDGLVTEQELEDWVRHVAHRYVYEDAERVWSYHDKNEDGSIEWEEYQHTAFGPIEDHNAVYDSHRGLNYQQILERDQRRFRVADKDGDGHLNKEEFANFLHPEEAGPHMRDIVIAETMEDMDKDKDGYVTIDEYLNDLWPQYEREQGGEEPDWVTSEREQFTNYRDQDKDGKLNKREIGDWVLPEDFDHANAEAKHLIYEADINKDKKLTKAEILEHQDLFVGSQATDFGDYLTRHDEF